MPDEPETPDTPDELTEYTIASPTGDIVVQLTAEDAEARGLAKPKASKAKTAQE